VSLLLNGPVPFCSQRHGPYRRSSLQCPARAGLTPLLPGIYVLGDSELQDESFVQGKGKICDAHHCLVCSLLQPYSDLMIVRLLVTATLLARRSLSL